MVLKPAREHATNNAQTYFVTSDTWERRALFHAEQRGFSDHRIRDEEDYDKHVHYIHLNPVKKHLCATAAEYRYSSAYPGWKLDPVPQGLKPISVEAGYGTTEVVPFQSKIQGLKPGVIEAAYGTTEVVPFQNMTQGLKPHTTADVDVRAEARTLPAKARTLPAEARTLQTETRILSNG